MDMTRLTNMNIQDNKSYICASLVDHPEVLSGCLAINNENYLVSATVLDTICKKSGVPNTTNQILRSKGFDIWKDTVLSLYNHYYGSSSIYFLLVNGTIEDVSFKSRQPLLHKEFLDRTAQFFTDYQDLVSLEDVFYKEDSNISEVLLFKKPVDLEKYPEYKVGILITNDEVGSVSCTLAIKYKSMVFYLPSKYCSLSSSRYMRTTSSAMEAYDMLLLRIISDMSTEDWSKVILEVVGNMDSCKSIAITYEDYRKAKRLLTRTAVASDLADTDISDMHDTLESEFSDFQENYPGLEDNQGSYIWRCSALGDNSVYSLVNSIDRIVKEYSYTSDSLKDVRQSLGEFIMLNKISQELAKKKER